MHRFQNLILAFQESALGQTRQTSLFWQRIDVCEALCHFLASIHQLDFGCPQKPCFVMRNRNRIDVFIFEWMLAGIHIVVGAVSDGISMQPVFPDYCWQSAA